MASSHRALPWGRDELPAYAWPLQLDARTGTDDTRYSIMDVPTTEKGLTDSVLLILKDWCSGISITEKDTEKQRGIIIEEWRQRGGHRQASQR